MSETISRTPARDLQQVGEAEKDDGSRDSGDSLENSSSCEGEEKEEADKVSKTGGTAKAQPSKVRLVASCRLRFVFSLGCIAGCHPNQI